MEGNKKDSRDEPKDLRVHGVPVYRQWICHSPKVMKTDILMVLNGDESGKSTQGLSDLIAQRAALKSVR
jgi:hypothetical protein